MPMGHLYWRRDLRRLSNFLYILTLPLAVWAGWGTFSSLLLVVLGALLLVAAVVRLLLHAAGRGVHTPLLMLTYKGETRLIQSAQVSDLENLKREVSESQSLRSERVQTGQTSPPPPRQQAPRGSVEQIQPAPPPATRAPPSPSASGPLLFTRPAPVAPPATPVRTVPVIPPAGAPLPTRPAAVASAFLAEHVRPPQRSGVHPSPPAVATADPIVRPLPPQNRPVAVPQAFRVEEIRFVSPPTPAKTAASPQASTTPDRVAPVPPTHLPVTTDQIASPVLGYTLGVAGKLSQNFLFRSQEQLKRTIQTLEVTLQIKVVLHSEPQIGQKFNPNVLAQWLTQQGFQVPGFSMDAGDAFLLEYAEPGTLRMKPSPAGQPPSAAAAQPFPFDLLILDCDDTLIWTGTLQQFRAQNLPCSGPDWEAALRQTFVAPGLHAWLQQVSALPGGPRLVVWSKARLAYVQALLAHHFPDIPFSAVWGYEDAQQHDHAYKPNPFLARRLLQEWGLDAARTAVLGDSQGDIQLAHTLGATGVLVNFYAQDKQRLRDWSYYKALEDLPQVVVETPAHLSAALQGAAQHDLPLDALYRGCTTGELARRLQHLRYQPYEDRPVATRLNVTCLGRYYTQGQASQKYPLPASSRHQVSQDILAKEQHDLRIPDEWVTATVWALRQLLTASSVPLVLTIIPAKPGRPQRLEALLASVATQLTGQLTCDPSVFHFRAGASSSKGMNGEERVNNARGNLSLHPAHQVHPGYRYVILDDVVTTGATLFQARDLLETVGVTASQIQGLALTKTLSVSRRTVVRA
jgi:phosphoglycolate phosphatase-like HAD superfamily hydrolase